MIVNKTFFIVKNCDDELVAVFTDKECCKEFIQSKYFEEELGYTEVRI